MPTAQDTTNRETNAAPSICPYLGSFDGAWVSRVASSDHRCRAVVPAAALTLVKQRRLCQTAEHPTCATYLAAREARLADAGSHQVPLPVWGWVRTTPIVDVRSGRASQLAAFMGDRRAWQVVPAAVLVAALGALGLSNLGAGSRPEQSFAPPSGAAAASPGVSATTNVPSPSSTASSAPTPTPSVSPSVSPTPGPTPTPVPSARTTYTVKSGDTLYGIAQTYGVTVTALKNFNGLTSTVLHTGQVLRIP